jgi:hypothetical protein
MPKTLLRPSVRRADKPVLSLADAAQARPQPFDQAPQGRESGEAAAGRRHGRRAAPAGLWGPGHGKGHRRLGAPTLP